MPCAFTLHSESLDLPLPLHGLSALRVSSTLRRQHTKGGKRTRLGFNFNIFVPRNRICTALLGSASDRLLWELVHGLTRCHLVPENRNTKHSVLLDFLISSWQLYPKLRCLVFVMKIISNKSTISSFTSLSVCTVLICVKKSCWQNFEIADTLTVYKRGTVWHSQDLNKILQ